MEIDYLLITKVILSIAIFIIMVRFIFSSSREEQESRLSAQEIKEEIREMKKSMRYSDMSARGEMMDSLMEEYYSSEKKGQ
jgi:uncharacterized membrane-anchored protein YhcB (DUF1043 family)